MQGDPSMARGVRCPHCGAPRPPETLHDKRLSHGVTVHRVACRACRQRYSTVELALPERAAHDDRRVDFAALARLARGVPAE